MKTKKNKRNNQKKSQTINYKQKEVLGGNESLTEMNSNRNNNDNDDDNDCKDETHSHFEIFPPHIFSYSIGTSPETLCANG